MNWIPTDGCECQRCTDAFEAIRVKNALKEVCKPISLEMRSFTLPNVKVSQEFLDSFGPTFMTEVPRRKQPMRILISTASVRIPIRNDTGTGVDREVVVSKMKFGEVRLIIVRGESIIVERQQEDGRCHGATPEAL